MHLPELSKSHLALGRFKVSLLIDFLYSLIIMLKKNNFSRSSEVENV